MAHLLQYLSTDSRYVQTSVSNKTGQCNILGQRDKLKILPRARRDQESLLKSEMGRGTGRYKILTAQTQILDGI